MGTKLSSLNIILWNAQSIKPKSIELFDFLKQESIHICLVTETWLLDNENIYDPGFSVYRLDRPGKPNSKGTLIGHGGVSILIRNNINHKLLPSFNLKIIEAIGIKVFTDIGDIIFIAAYFPGTSDSSKFQFFKMDLQKLTNQNNPYFIGCDLNAKNQAWNCIRGNRTGKILHTESQIKNFDVLFPPTPTHYSKKSKYPSTLGLLLTNYTELISHLQTKDRLSSDHQFKTQILKIEMASHTIGKLTVRF